MKYKSLESSVCHCINLRRASRSLTEYYDRALKPCGLTVCQYSIMRNIQRIEPCSVSELSKNIRLDRTTLVRNLKSLIQRGLISDETPAKQRARILHCSPDGDNLLDKAVHEWEKAQKELESCIGQKEIRQLEEMLLKIEELNEKEESQ